MLAGCILFTAGLVLGVGLSTMPCEPKTPSLMTVLENTKVQVNRVVYEENDIRKGHVRANDQVIIFLDDAQYEALYSDGRKETKRRQAGEVIWHNRGEDAPTLTNTGKGSYQTLMVNLK